MKNPKDNVNEARFQDEVVRANAERAVNWTAEGRKMRRENPDRWERDVTAEMNRQRASNW